MRSLIIPAFALSILTVSCKKEKDILPVTQPVTQAVPKKISKAVYTFENEVPEVETFTYDALGRPAVYAKDGHKDVFDFQSAFKLVVTRFTLPANTIEKTIDCTINEKGAITQMLFKDPANMLTYTYTFTYNSDGYMTWLKGEGGSSFFEETAEIKDGNFTNVKRSFNGILTYNDEYIYNTIPNTIPGGFFAYWPVADLFGKPSKNLLGEFKAVKLNGTVNWHIKNNFTVDATGTVNKYTTDYVLSGEKSVYELSYQ